MSRVDPERWGSLAVALGALLVAATCSRESRLEPVLPTRSEPAPAKSALTPSPRPSSSAPEAAPALALPARDPLSFEHFGEALAELEAKSRKDHVRVLWLGDSHTAADFLTGALRRKLSLRFGPGGPGFVRLGTSPYRHEGVKVVREGRWRLEPEPPSSRSSEGDTAFGIAGLRAIPTDTRARIEARLDARTVKGTVHYQVLFDLPRGASFKLAVGQNRHLIDERTQIARVPGSPIGRLRLEGPASDGLEISSVSGAPRFYGMLAEGNDPGVVLDTSGIDGARVATALAWNADVLAAEVRARPPELFAVAYGTNEAFDNRRAEVIGVELGNLVERLRRGAPNADCLVVGPPDAAAPDLSSLPRVVEIDDALARASARLGCGFFSLRRAMGGDGGFAHWMRATPPLARGDRIHLTPAGYEQLGEALAGALIGAYESRRP